MRTTPFTPAERLEQAKKIIDQAPSAEYALLRRWAELIWHGDYRNPHTGAFTELPREAMADYILQAYKLLLDMQQFPQYVRALKII